MLYKCIMANTSAIWQQAAHTTYELSSPSCSTRTIQKSLPLNGKYLRIFWNKSQENGPFQKNYKTERAKGLGRKNNKRGDRKGETNDSPEIQTGGRHQTSPASLQGLSRSIYIYIYIRYNKVQACFLVDTFYSEFSPLRALLRPGWLD